MFRRVKQKEYDEQVGTSTEDTLPPDKTPRYDPESYSQPDEYEEE